MTPDQCLDLASRNDGYLVIAGDTSIGELLNAGLITVKYIGDGCLIARAVHFQTSHHSRTATGQWARRHHSKWQTAVERGAVLA